MPLFDTKSILYTSVSIVDSLRVILQTLDVIGKTAFGYDFNSLETPNDPLNMAFRGILEATDIKQVMS